MSNRGIAEEIAEKIYPQLPAYFRMKHILPLIDEKYRGQARRVLAVLHKKGKIEVWGTHIWKKCDGMQEGETK